MSAVIHKYPIHPGVNILAFPSGAEVIHAGTQNAEPTIWVWQSTDTQVPTVRREIVVLATGEEFNDVGYKHLGSCVDAYGWMGVHVFEAKES